jgi:membrane-associated protease RseP (regulator of RpoE activity)
VLKDLVARKQNIPWAQFVKLSQADYVRKAMTCYPQGRYMMMYLYDKGLLKTWYDAYLAGYEADPTGAKALEEVLKKPLAEAEKDWLAWLAGAKPVPVVLPPRHAYLGVRVAGQTDGLQIAQLVPGSGADKAGLKAGDVIVRLDGARVIEAADLVATIDKRQVGDKILVQYRRDGKYQEATVVLEAMPESVAGVPATTSAPSIRPRPTTRPRPATTSAPSPGRFRRGPTSRPAAAGQNSPLRTPSTRRED